jgi:hypothetical protein
MFGANRHRWLYLSPPNGSLPQYGDAAPIQGNALRLEARVQGDQVGTHRSRRRTAIRGSFGRLGAVTVGSVLMAVLLAPSAMAADRSVGDITTAASVGSDFLGIPLITMLWLITGVLAVAVGLAAASRRSRGDLLATVTSELPAARSTVTGPTVTPLRGVASVSTVDFGQKS